MNATKDTGKKLMEIYNLAYKRFGPRHWWPADTPFEVIIGAILTQFVSWSNVEKAISRLKEANLLSIGGICDADMETLEELIRSTRFYKQKARKLKAFCCHIRDKYDGDLQAFLDRPAGQLRKELLSLYGIGEETADSIILYAAKKPVFVVDAYTKRIFERLGLLPAGKPCSYCDVQGLFMDNLEHNAELFNEYHALIVSIGKDYCFPSEPKCTDCPLFLLCQQ